MERVDICGCLMGPTNGKSFGWRNQYDNDDTNVHAARDQAKINVFREGFPLYILKVFLVSL